ncbi:hypothetical protein B0H63DRAFT_262115 [Podospora didyma]|uniref:Uncharacterized protein n=1 Tax=Podospora didyma TaxID=330526 RepID=A0AAE0N9A1_9PEZI|nr:hypothetical protein B0H63DRAFT_262115 [Podospora didyma]
MSYILYTASFAALAMGTVLYFTRARWLPSVQETFANLNLPGQNYLYSALPGSTSNTFSGDMEAGLSSSTFDLSGNVADGDGRAGLDNAAKREILKIMKRRRLRFDEARRVYMEQRFQANGIGADGRPKDPKFVSFS